MNWESVLRELRSLRREVTEEVERRRGWSAWLKHWSGAAVLVTSGHPSPEAAVAAARQQLGGAAEVWAARDDSPTAGRVTRKAARGLYPTKALRPAGYRVKAFTTPE